MNAVVQETGTESNETTQLQVEFTHFVKHAVKARMPVEGEEKKKTRKLAEFDVPYPTLAESVALAMKADLTAYQAKEDGTLIESDGVPQLQDKVAQWLQDSILEAVLSDARSIIRVEKDDNKQPTGNVALAPGKQFSVNWEQLLTERARGRDPVKRLHKELAGEFATWMLELKKTAKTTQFVIGLFANPDVLPLQPQDRREKFLENYFAPFVNNLSDDDVTTYTPAIALIEAAANADVDALTGEDF